MYIIDFKTETIRKFTIQEVADFCNDLIHEQSQDFLGKRYLFVPTKKAALYLVNKMMNNCKGVL